MELPRLALHRALDNNSDRVILGGHRRWRVALGLGLSEVPCVVEDFDDEQVAIVELNRQRVETPRERYREAQVLRRELEPKARKQQGARTDLLSDLTRSSISSTHVRDEIPGKLGVSSGQLYKIEFIYEHESLAPEVVRRLDEGRITVHKAYGLVKSKLRNTALQAHSEPEKKPVRKKLAGSPLTIGEPAKIILDRRSRTVGIQFTVKITVE